MDMSASLVLECDPEGQILHAVCAQSPPDALEVEAVWSERLAESRVVTMGRARGNLVTRKWQVAES